MTRRRLDRELVRRGILETREEAQEAIAAGLVTVAGAPADKAARQVAPDEAILVAGPPRRFVGRGGDKLDAGLERFGIDVTGRRCLDVGASTGGFTDCLLQRGAAHVYAVDVGYGQLDRRLREDPRVTVRERRNARDLTLTHVGGEAVDVAVADVSFISLRTITPAVISVVATGGEFVYLVKPQFEAARPQVGKGGVVRDPDVWLTVLERVQAALAAQNLHMVDVMASPLRGAEGNVEFLTRLQRGWPEGRLTREDFTRAAGDAPPEK